MSTVARTAAFSSHTFVARRVVLLLWNRTLAI